MDVLCGDLLDLAAERQQPAICDRDGGLREPGRAWRRCVHPDIGPRPLDALRTLFRISDPPDPGRQEGQRASR